MKRLKYFLICALALPLLGSTGCSDNIDAEFEPIKTDQVLTILDPKDQKVSFSAAPSTHEVTFSTNTRWAVKVECDGGWCTVDKFSGSGDGSFTISVLENLSEKRECKVILMKTDAKGEQNGNKLDINIYQEASNVHLSPSELEAFSAHAASRKTFSIIANVDWTLNVEYDTPEASGFVKVDPKEGMQQDGTGFKGEGAASFEISLTDNNSTAARLAYLTLRSEVGSYSVEIRQLGSDYSFSVSPFETQRIAARGDTIRFGVLSISEWTVSADATWIEFTTSKGNGSVERETTDAVIAPNASDSVRSARVLFTPVKEGYSPVEVTVVQEAVSTIFRVSNNPSAIIPVDGGSTSLTVYSSFNWTVECPDWVTPSVRDGSADRDVRFTFSRNPENAPRDARIRIVPHASTVDGVDVDPSTLHVAPIECFVTQMGGNALASDKGPEIIPQGFKLNEVYIIKADDDGNTLTPVVFTVKSQTGLTSFKINIDSTTLTPEELESVGLSADLDLINPGELEGQHLNGLGFPTGENVKGQTECKFDISGFVPMLMMLGPGEHKFNLTVSDDNGTATGVVFLKNTTAGQRPGAGDNPTPEP